MPTVTQSIQKLSNTEFAVQYLFGGGINSAVSSQSIDIRECSDGENFDLLLEAFDKLRTRAPIDLVGTATNAETIHGIIEHQAVDGSVTMLVQAGGTVYQWDGSTFTSKGTVSPNARLRGGRYSTSELDDFVIITDLNLVENVKTWDGTTFTDFVHNLGGNFKARYCRVENERAIFLNVHSGATATPHVILVSAGLSTTTASAVGTLTVANRPSSSLSATDPFFLPIPDLKAINGVEVAFGVTAVSTEGGQVWQITGSSSKDYSITPLYKSAAAKGDESIISTGNDILYGKSGGIESLVSVNSYGDVETDDITRYISDQVNEIKEWTGVYNPRVHKAYWWGLDGNEVYVFNQFLYDPKRNPLDALAGKSELSPWSKWTTAYGNGDFRQTAVALCKRPGDKLDTVYFGTAGGKLFQLEGSGDQDGGSSDVTLIRTLPMFEIPNAESYDISGYIGYEKLSAATLTLDFLCSGKTVFDDSITITIPAISGGSYFGGAVYFGGAFYFGAQFEGRITRQIFSRALRTELLEPRITVAGADFKVNHLYLKVSAAPLSP